MAGLFTPPYMDVGAGITPSDGALLYFNTVGSEVDKDTYTTAAATIAHANPVVADAKGVFPAIYIVGDYDWILTDKSSIQQNTGSVSEFATVSSTAFDKNFAIMADATADTGIVEGDAINLAERTTGNGGSSFWDVIAGVGTANTYDRVAHDTLDLTLVYRVIDGEVNPVSLGLIGDGVTDGDAALLAAVDYCKGTGDSLKIPSGTYNAALVVDWALQRTQADTLKADGAYDPGTLNQPGYIGYCFNIDMDRNAVFLKESFFERMRGPCTIQGGEFRLPLIMSNLLQVNFKNVRCPVDVASLTYFSSDIASARYPLRYAFQFSSLANGSSFWVDYSHCQFARGFVMGGTEDNSFALNMITGYNTFFSGGDSTLHPIGGGSESYLDTRGAGMYLDCVTGHNDGMTFEACDFSYGEMPIWNDTAQVIQLIGCYYEGCTVLNAITSDGVTPGNLAANIQYGFDYDRDDISGNGSNKRTGLRVSQSFNLNAANETSTIGLKDFNGGMFFTDISETKNIGQYINGSQVAGNGESLSWKSFTSRSGDQETVYNCGARTYQNFNTSGKYYEETIATLASVTRTMSCNSGADIGANGTMRITAMGAPNTTSPGTPSFVEGTITKSGAGTWTFTPLTGSLVGSRTTLVIGSASPNNNSITVQLTNDSGGTWTGILHIETNLAAGELTSGGKEIRWTPIS